eukprot:8146124-Alexandrium_andersonii.AAC.1
MSASLVGSEMCIRDSFLMVMMVLFHDVREKHSRELGGERVTGAEFDEAVSYTHLTLPTICSV